MQGVFLTAGVILAALSDTPTPTGYRYGLIVSLAVAMGIQNASARKLAVADLTTTVLTLTITGIAADSVILGGKGSKAGRRMVAVGAMLSGAVIGATFVVHAHIVYPLAIALIVIVAVAAVTRAPGVYDGAWVSAES